VVSFPCLCRRNGFFIALCARFKWLKKYIFFNFLCSQSYKSSCTH
jgi:hypothetical protein